MAITENGPRRLVAQPHLAGLWRGAKQRSAQKAGASQPVWDQP